MLQEALHRHRHYQSVLIEFLLSSKLSLLMLHKLESPRLATEAFSAWLKPGLHLSSSGFLSMPNAALPMAA